MAVKVTAAGLTKRAQELSRPTGVQPWWVKHPLRHIIAQAIQDGAQVNGLHRALQEAGHGAISKQSLQRFRAYLTNGGKVGGE